MTKILLKLFGKDVGNFILGCLMLVGIIAAFLGICIVVFGGFGALLVHLFPYFGTLDSEPMLGPFKWVGVGGGVFIFSCMGGIVVYGVIKFLFSIKGYFKDLIKRAEEEVESV